MSKKIKRYFQRTEWQMPLNVKKIVSIVLILNFILVGTVAGIKLYYDPPEILMNQAGFLPDFQKQFLVRSTTLETRGSYAVYDINGTAVLEDQDLLYLGKQWGSHYYLGDFSDFNVPGNYAISVEFGHRQLKHVNFQIDSNVYDLSLERAQQFFYYQRANCEVGELIPGYVGHGLAHMDDGVWLETENGEEWYPLLGGWYSAGDYSKFVLWGLHIFGSIHAMASTYNRVPHIYENTDLYSLDGSLDPNGIPDILDEIMWGVNYSRSLILPNGTVLGSVKTGLDFVPPERDTGMRTLHDVFPKATAFDQLWLVAALGESIIAFQESGHYLEALQGILDDATDLYDANVNTFQNEHLSDIDAVPLLAASHALYKLFEFDEYYDNATFAAERILTTLNQTTRSQDELGTVDRALATVGDWILDVNAEALKEDYLAVVERRYELEWRGTESPYNLFDLMQIFYYEENIQTESQYFIDRIGVNSRLLFGMAAAINAYRVSGETEAQYLNFALNQLDWILGKNPLGLSMVEGVGFRNAPAYHHRFSTIPGNPRGAVPGAIPNGYILGPDGNPYFDMGTTFAGISLPSSINYRSNEPWLPHNIAYLNALSILASI